MNQSTWQQFDPAGLFAHWAPCPIADHAAQVEFEAGFDEGEKARSETNLYLATKDSGKEGHHGVEHVGDRYIAVDHQAFYLVEGVLVGGVSCLAAKDPAWENGAKGRF